MQDTSKYAVGIDVGTTMVRCVVGRVDTSSTEPTVTVVGVGESPNNGMRKGIVNKLSGPSKAIDDALGEAERMSGYQVDYATLSINGSHIMSTRVNGMVAVNAAGNEIAQDDISRVEAMAITGKVPANRDTIDVIPYSYKLDGQEGIKDPLGMVGSRLELHANVISTLMPHLANLQKVAENASVHPNSVIPSVIAAAQAVVSEQQLEGGIAVIDFGGATTGVAIYEEGDLQYAGVIPVGGNNITNDLAIGLQTDPEIAEKVKISHASALLHNDDKTVSVERDGKKYNFQTSDIDEIVEARLEEMFEAIGSELDKAGCRGKLPNGVLLVGGGAQLKGLVTYAKRALKLAASKGKPHGFEGFADTVGNVSYAAAIGLMLHDVEHADNCGANSRRAGGRMVEKGGSLLGRLFDRFRAS